MALSLDQYKALLRLNNSNNQDWECLKQALKDLINNDRNQLEQSNITETMYRLQGRIGALKDLLESIESSKEIVRQYS